MLRIYEFLDIFLKQFIIELFIFLCIHLHAQKKAKLLYHYINIVSCTIYCVAKKREVDSDHELLNT